MIHYFFLLTAILILLAGITLLKQASDNQPRRFLGLVFTILGVMGIIPPLMGFPHPMPHPVLTLPRLREGGIIITLICIYEIMVIRPGWINLKRTTCLFAPCLAIAAILAITSADGITPLGGFADIAPNIARPDVVGRLASFLLLQSYFLVVILLPFALCRYQPRKRRWLYGLAALCTTTSICYEVFVLTGYPEAIIGNRISFTLLTAYLTIGALRTDDPSRLSPELPQMQPAPAQPVSPTQALYNRLAVLMETTAPWLDPNLTISTLATQLNSNRTTLSAAIREQGFSSFNEYVNRYRVNEFIRLVIQQEAGADDDITSLWNAAGFRSKSTFYRSFIQCEGITPYKFMQNRPKM